MKKALSASLSLLFIGVCLKTHAQAPVISSLNPTQGAVGSDVIITGNNFNASPASNIVYFGATRAMVASASTTRLRVTVPAGLTNQPISVLNMANGLQAASRNTFTPIFKGNRLLVKEQFSSTEITGMTNVKLVALSDIDGDGKSDIISIIPGDRQLCIIRNIATPGSISSASFGPKTLFTTLINPVDITIGDVDGDGKPDVLVVAQNNNRVSIFRNTSTAGNISFAPRIDIATETAPACVAIGDMDNDGKPDLLVGTAGTQNYISVYKNNSLPGNISTTTFAARVNFALGASKAKAVNLTDVDGDGKLDLLLLDTHLVAPNNYQYGQMIIYRNTSATGTINQSLFAANPPMFDLGVFVYNKVSVTDMNADGKPDVILHGEKTLLYINQAVPGIISSASFADNVTTFYDEHSDGLALGDLNGDGKPDMVKYGVYVDGFDDEVGNLDTYGLVIQTNNIVTGTNIYSSSFGTPVVLPYTPANPDIYPGSIALGDIDGDNRPDFVVANTSNNSLSIYRNSIVNPPAITSFSPARGAVGTAVTINGSGFNPIAANNIISFGAVRADVNTASATQLNITVPAGASYQPVSVLNTDVQLTGYSAAPFNITFPATAMTLAPKVDFVTKSQPAAVTTADLDGDGKPDMVVTYAGNNSISIFRNVAYKGEVTTTSFSLKTDFNTSAGPLSVQVADIDANGKPDLIVTASQINKVCVFRNTSGFNGTPDITFAPKLLFTTTTKPVAIAIADFDNDGKPDIATADTANRISILRNTSVGSTANQISFDAQLTFGTGNNPRSMAAADLDQDGRTDIVVTNSTDNTISVFYNNTPTGDGSKISFAPKVDFATGTNPQGVAIGDLNNDGKPDIAVANKDDNTVSVFRNTATTGIITSSSFATKTDFAAGTAPQGLTIADINGNGNPEVIVSNSGSNNVSVMLNHSLGSAINLLRYTAAAGTNPTGINTGDIDGDGRPDVLVTNTGSNTVSVLRNSSPPQDAPLSRVPPVITSLNPAKGDVGSMILINGDNFNPNADKNIVQFGSVPAVVNSATTTQLQVTVPVGSQYQPISVINTDNYLRCKSYQSFITTFPSKNSVTAADFDPRVDFDQFSFEPDLKDVDGDSKLDLINFSRSIRNMSTPGNITTGSFDFNSNTYPANYDLNADGKPDLVQNISPVYRFAVYPNITKKDSAFTFGPQIRIDDVILGDNSTIDAAEDIDGDGKTDLASIYYPDTDFDPSADPTQALLQVIYNQSDGRNIQNRSYSDGPHIPLSNDIYTIQKLKLVDIDGDHKPDILALTNGDKNAKDYRLLAFRNTSTPGHASFNAPVIYPNEGDAQDFFTGDIDGDGKPDLVTTNSSTGGFRVYHNESTTGGATWNPFPASIKFETAYSFSNGAFGDIDGDGKVDFITNRLDGTKYYTAIYRNTATPGSITSASFAPKTDLASGSSTLVIGDIDGDGKPDIITSSAINGKFAIYRNNPVMPPGLLARLDTLQPLKITSKVNSLNPISVHQGISPNGDGVNDILLIDNIDNYADNKVTILNINGAKVFETSAYNNSTNAFSGLSNTGIKQKAGTYYYQLEYTDKGEKQIKTGYVVLKY